MYIASTFRRTIAHILDEMIGCLFWFPLVIAAWSQLSKGNDSVVLSWKWLAYVWLARISYEIICVYILQALPAQFFLGLRIMSTHHPELKLGFFQTIVRVLTGQLKYILGPSIYFMALWHRERQHLGDLLAETRVVQIYERNFKIKTRWILGSMLVYFSLLMNLSEAVNLMSDHQITQQGLEINLPMIEFI